MSEFVAKKSALARRLKLDDEIQLPQLVEMFGPKIPPYLQASQPAPLIHIEGNSETTPNATPTGDEEAFQNNTDAEVDETSEVEIRANSKCDELAAAKQEVESHVNSECDELVATAEEEEIPAKDSDAEVDVGRDDIVTDVEVEHRIHPEGDEVLEKPLDHAISVVLHIQESNQRRQVEVHAQSVTQEAPNRDRSTDAKPDVLHMSDAVNEKAMERTLPTPAKSRHRTSQTSMTASRPRGSTTSKNAADSVTGATIPDVGGPNSTDAAGVLANKNAPKRGNEESDRGCSQSRDTHLEVAASVCRVTSRDYRFHVRPPNNPSGHHGSSASDRPPDH
ncbi:hypothetical protein FQA39_LY00831 [Lamprigera yunnana]|nr:hypothetical protein FQA39_LY00831 [Lamprigera yunnana]